MHVTNLIALILCVLVAVHARYVNDDSEIERINALGAGWEAGHNDRFSNVTTEQAGGLLGLNEVPMPVSDIAARDVSEAEGLPSFFDSRQKWPSCVMPIRDQGSCGACWAFAASSVFGMRMCIQTNGAAKIDMSPQASINCNTANNGCSGGTLGNSWEYFVNSGTVADFVVPYTGKKVGCSISSSANRYKASGYSRPNTVAAMQYAIYNNGALQVGMDVYSDFYNYKSGVYSRTSSRLAGGHSVYLVGWGTQNGQDYWIAINSWGTNFGNKGSFLIARGVNMCNMEKGYMPIYGSVADSSLPTRVTTKAPSTTTRAPTTTTRAPATTTRAPTTTTPNCWTCYPGYVHWFSIPGYAAPSDKCACVRDTSSQATTTRAPATTRATTTTQAPVRNCWTCPAGFVHWYDIPNYAEPSDKCACVVRPATTKAPTSLADITTKMATTTAPARNCWTCPAGFVHWYDIPGYAEPSDKCACVTNPNTRNCWTCPAGFVHWYDKPGYAEPTDKCACVPK